MEELQIFNNPEFGEIRTVNIDGEPWFVGNDVAKPLGYAEPKNAISRWVDDDDKLRHQFDTSGQNRDMVIINESGVYSLIFGSKMPNAKKFKKWVTSEVLPAIRKTGSYQLPQTPDQKIQLLAQGYVEIRNEVNTVKESVSSVKSEVQQLKDELPIFLNEAQLLTDAVKKKGVEVLGSKNTEAYNDRSMRCTVYHDIYTELYRQFGITTYKALKRNQLNDALEIINNYKAPYIIREKIKNCNAQERMAI